MYPYIDESAHESDIDMNERIGRRQVYRPAIQYANKIRTYALHDMCHN